MNKTANFLFVALLWIVSSIALARTPNDEPFYKGLETGTPFRIVMPNITPAYLPLTKQEMGEPFPLHKERSIDPSLSVPVAITAGSDVAYIGIDSNLIAYGEDKHKNNWRVVISQPSHYEMLPIDLYTADLDHNGLLDVVIMVPTGGNGLAPSVHFVALMFDENGKPVPFEADGYFEPQGKGIDYLVDMNGDGKTELVYMNFDNGYWITNVYTSQNARWSKIEGLYRKRKFPLFTRFTNRPNSKPVTPMPNRHPFGPDLSNDKPILEGRLVSFHIPEENSDVEMTFADATGKLFKCTPFYWYGSARVVYDTAKGRQIALLDANDKENAELLLNQIIAKKDKVLLYGQRYPDKCSPEISWAIHDD